MNKKQVFFKTVRQDGSSIWARGPLKRVFEIGKRYRFPEQFPAHVFTVDFVYADNLGEVYARRCKPAGNRVLICWGVVKERDVPVLEIHSFWDFRTGYPFWALEKKLTSTSFEVIGEIFSNDSVPEGPNYHKNKSVIGFKELLKTFKKIKKNQ